MGQTVRRGIQGVREIERERERLEAKGWKRRWKKEFNQTSL